MGIGMGREGPCLLYTSLGLEDDEEETDVRGNVVCPTCGTSFEDFVENSRFGCADCYGVFELFIKDKMKQLQGSESHKGKHPKYRSTFEKEHPEAALMALASLKLLHLIFDK